MDLPLHPAFFSFENSTTVRSSDGALIVPAAGLPPREDSFRLRAAGPEDREDVAAFLSRLDRETRYLRHWSHAEAANDRLLDRLASVDHRDREALVAVAPRHGGEWIVGHAEYAPETDCTIAAGDCGVQAGLVVEAAWRRRGVGKALLAGLARLAAAAGWRRMYGEVLHGNEAMLGLARGLGFRLGRSGDPRTLRIERALPTP